MLVEPDLFGRLAFREEEEFVLMLVYGAKTPFGNRMIVWRLHSSRSRCLMRVLMPSPKRVPSGKNNGRASTFL